MITEPNFMIFESFSVLPGSATTEPNRFWNYLVLDKKLEQRIAESLTEMFGIIFGNLGGAITELKLSRN